MTNIKSEIISRQCIRPSSPTPPQLKTFKLSLLDQLYPAIHGNMTFFFQANTQNLNNTGLTSEFSNKSQILQKSLSKALSFFYPFAGRLVDATSIDCNDKGALFVEAKINANLSNFLNQPDSNMMDPLLPTNDPKTMELSNGAMLLIQFTSFNCGGVAMSLSLTHKLADIASMITFLHSWTAIACNNEPRVPDWSGASLLPPKDDLPAMSASVNTSSDKFVAKRFVFSATKIAELKAKAIAEGVQNNPSRVEVVLALLWKSAITSKKAKSRSFKPSALFQAVNLRQRMTPPIPDSTMGNFVWPFLVLAQEEKDLEIHKLVTKMRKAFNDLRNDKAYKFSGEEGCLMVLDNLKKRQEFFKDNKDLNVYKCSAWCKFPLYDTDFGWGKPIWHFSVNKLANNTISLADTRSRDGIEAVVTLDEEEMTIFECNEELLQFASLNPSAYA